MALYIGTAAVTKIEINGVEVTKIEDANGNVLYNAAPPKIVTFDATDPDSYGFDYTIGGNSGTVTQGTSVIGTVNDGETLSVTTQAVKAHLFINGNNQGNGPSYSYTYAQITDGDVFTCFWDSEPS